MEIIFYVLAKTVSILLGVASIAMLVRMLLPIFVDAEGNAIYALACMLSEPFIAPVRAIFMLFNIAQEIGRAHV